MKLRKNSYMAMLNSKNFSSVHMLWVVIILITLITQWFHSDYSVRYDRHLIENGSFWLLVSGHFVHLNWPHWAMNIAGFVMVGYFFISHGSVLHWLSIIAISVVFVSFGLYWLHPEIIWYVGLSGVLHGLCLFGVIREIKFYPMSGYVLLVLFAVKLSWEKIFGPLPGSEDMISGVVLTDAHLYGAIGGVVGAGVIALIVKLRAVE